MSRKKLPFRNKPPLRNTHWCKSVSTSPSLIYLSYTSLHFSLGSSMYSTLYIKHLAVIWIKLLFENIKVFFFFSFTYNIKGKYLGSCMLSSVKSYWRNRGWNLKHLPSLISSSYMIEGSVQNYQPVALTWCSTVTSCRQRRQANNMTLIKPYPIQLCNLKPFTDNVKAFAEERGFWIMRGSYFYLRTFWMSNTHLAFTGVLHKDSSACKTVSLQPMCFRLWCKRPDGV